MLNSLSNPVLGVEDVDWPIHWELIENSDNHSLIVIILLIILIQVIGPVKVNILCDVFYTPEIFRRSKHQQTPLIKPPNSSTFQNQQHLLMLVFPTCLFIILPTKVLCHHHCFSASHPSTSSHPLRTEGLSQQTAGSKRRPGEISLFQLPWGQLRSMWGCCIKSMHIWPQNE